MNLFSKISFFLFVLLFGQSNSKYDQSDQLNYGVFSHSCLAFIHEKSIGQIVLKGKVLDNNGSPLIGANVVIKGTTIGTIVDINGQFSLEYHSYPPFTIVVSYTGFTSQTILITNDNYKVELIITLSEGVLLGEEVLISASRRSEKNWDAPANINTRSRRQGSQHSQFEQYGLIKENKFNSPLKTPLSTFSVDVDRAAYSNVRRFINNGMKPPKDAVRIEEMINYFNYQYKEPTGKDPITIHQTLIECPWNEDHQLLHIGLQAKTIPTEDLPYSNFVFLIDVSGSMRSQNKLPLVKSSLKNLLNNLRDGDKVAIVSYSGSATVSLESTNASDKTKIIAAINSLRSGGSTAGGQGIQTAYEIAEQNFLQDGNNRIILATDGDFNVGIRSPKALEQLVEQKRQTGIFLSVLGYGIGNYKDEQMQSLAQKGNGNHAYIDNLQEANKVLVHEFGGTLFTLAKDVKLQIEFNPAYVSNYRLIGYESRLLNPEDFNNDKKDAGEIGSGHTVTAIYEIIPVGSESSFVSNIDKLKYQTNTKLEYYNENGELATIKFRFKKPDEDKSKKIVSTVSSKVSEIKNAEDDVKFAIAVAEFGMLLRDSDFIHNGNYEDVLELAKSSRGKDEQGYRAEFIRLVEAVNGLDL